MIKKQISYPFKHCGALNIFENFSILMDSYGEEGGEWKEVTAKTLSGLARRMSKKKFDGWNVLAVRVLRNYNSNTVTQ